MKTIKSRYYFFAMMVTMMFCISAFAKQDGWNKEFSSKNYDTLYVINSGGAVNVNLNGLTKVSFTPAGATEPKNMLVIAADNNSMVLADLKLTGGNLDIVGDIRVGKNTWGGSAATPPYASGLGGYVDAAGLDDKVCPAGEFMIGVTKNAAGVNRLICAKL